MLLTGCSKTLTRELTTTNEFTPLKYRVTKPIIPSEVSKTLTECVIDLDTVYGDIERYKNEQDKLGKRWWEIWK